MQTPYQIKAIRPDRLISWLLLSTVIATFPAIAAETAQPTQELEEGSNVETVWEFDPYYTDVDLYIPLTRNPIPTITSDDELQIYRQLIQGSAIPRYMLLEASVYPMPAAGTWLKHNDPDFYRNWDIGKGGSNVIDAITAGFQEPWAVSAFFGNIARLSRPGSEQEGTNWGYSGYLVSAGTKHIKDNVLLDDNWYELEWKIKGKRYYPQDKQVWSFRIGGKFHDNPGITNVTYLSIHRNNLNSRFSFLDWFRNTEADFKLHFAQQDAQLVRLEMIFGKKYPLPGHSYTPTLNIGFIWASPNEYSGQLRTGQYDSLTLVIRPSVEF